MLAGIIARVRSYWRTLRKPEQLGAEMDEEMRFHLEMEAARRAREDGLDPQEARRQATIAFGGVQQHKESGRDARGLTWMTGLSLDTKLAWRMLGKSPALTVIGVLGIALGTAVGVAFFVLTSMIFFPKVPLNEGDRLVALENWDVEANRPAPQSLHDFVTWRNEMRSIQPIAAAGSMGGRALVTGDAVPEIVSGAAMTAAGFQIARVPPLIGRYLTPDDERENAPLVVVIGYDLWKTRLAGDPMVIGRRILVDGFGHDVIGVMPPGFAFPKDQSLWTALRASPARHVRGKGPTLFVFGRLAPGATWQQARAELEGIGRRTAVGFPETNARLRPQILPYTHPLGNVRALQLAEVAGLQMMVTLLLIAVSVNVGMLVYARTAMRQGELAVRTALGATRRRIVGQLFVEALLLSLLGAGLGLVAAHAALREAAKAFEPNAAFWIDLGFQPRSVAFALALAIIAAVIVGVVPGLKATGRGLNASLQLFRSGGSVRLGHMWTALIVAQVAVVVTVLPTALRTGYEEIRLRAVRATFPARELVSATLGLAVPIRPSMTGEDYQRETEARFAVALPELERTLEAEPNVAGVTLEGSGGDVNVEIDSVPGSAASGVHPVASRGIAFDYFEVLGARILAGRAFASSDAGSPGAGLVVSEAFVRRALRGERALGRRVRFPSRSATGERVIGRWLEIVGVVEDPYANAFDPDRTRATVYYHIDPRRLQAATLLVRVRGGDANAFIPRLQQIAANRDSDFRLGRISNLAVMPNSRYIAVFITGLVFALLTVVLLSAVGIHALMALTVTRRRKEIGIRIALGANRGRLLMSIFSRAAWQLGLGGLVGSVLGGVLLRLTGQTGSEAATLLGAVLGLMLMAGLLAAARPARRGVRIQPMDALRADD